MTENPFTLSFGKIPQTEIQRFSLKDEVIDTFNCGNPGYQACMITGVRGSGKTVAMTSIANELAKDSEWIVLNLNPERDLLNSLAAELSNRKDLFELFRDAKINLSFLGFGLEIDGEPPITDIVVAIRRMLQKLTKSGKKVLITIDEVQTGKDIRVFVNQIQIFLRENLNVFLLLTGLYSNIDTIQNEKTLTFLMRSPKEELKPLDFSMILNAYQKTFQIGEDCAREMAKLTMGYSFAFQLLGYLCWKRNAGWRDVLPEFDEKLAEYTYKKIWSECSGQDKEILKALAELQGSGKVKIEKLREKISIDSNKFNTYKYRLVKSGLIVSCDYGYVRFALPRFDVFIKNYSWLD